MSSSTSLGSLVVCKGVFAAVNDITVNRLYSVFVDMDRDGAGTIDLQEMIRYLRLEETPFTDRVFHLFGAFSCSVCVTGAQSHFVGCTDSNADGHIDFTEFVNAVWMFCPLDIKALVTFAFKLYEPTIMTPDGPKGQGHLSIEDMKLMLEEVYGQMTNLNSRLEPLYEDLDANDDQRVNLPEFKSMNDKYSSLLFPAFRMQLRLRQAILGEPFWEEQMRRRIREGEVTNESLWEIMRELDAQRRKANRGALAEMAKGRWVPDDLPEGTYIPAPGLTFKARSNPTLAQRELLIRAGVIKVKKSEKLKKKLAESSTGGAKGGAAATAGRPTRRQREAQAAQSPKKSEAKQGPVMRAALDNELNRAMARAKRR